jgi:hypothetical protein
MKTTCAALALLLIAIAGLATPVSADSFTIHGVWSDRPASEKTPPASCSGSALHHSSASRR